MVRFRVQVPNRDAAAVTRCVAREGLLHLIDLAHGRVPSLGPPPQAQELLAAFRDLSHRIRQLAQRIGATLPEPAGSLDGGGTVEFGEERERLEAELRPIEKSIDATWRALALARERKTQAEEALARARLLERAAVEVARLTRMRFGSVRLALAAEEDLAPLAAVLSPAPFALVPLEREGARWLFAAAAPASAAERLESALRVASCELVPLGAAAADPGAVKKAAEEEQHALDELAHAKTTAVPVLERLLPRADVGVLLLQAETLFASSGRFIVLSGWLPAEDAERLRKLLRDTTHGRAVVDVERPEDLPEASRAGLKIPILHRNPLLLRPFLSLVRLYGTPSYEEVEPTAFFAISFLLMFGLMFGDIGHGFVLFAAGFCLFRWLPRFLDYGILLMEGGSASMIFGALYGSVFGVEDWLPALWLRPIHDLSRFMTVAVTLGIVLVSAGLVLNIVNLWRSGQRATALFSSHGLFGAFLYWVMLVLMARAFVPADLTVPMWLVIGLAAVPVLLLLLRPLLGKRLQPARRAPAGHAPIWLMALEGSVELVDSIFSLFTNTISFVRIAAFAAVHAGISIALFALVDTLSRMRFGSAMSVLAIVAGNMGVILLEGLTVSVQVLRLEYYEFFTKFFRGGGQPYRPLMLQPNGEVQ
ncbi:MAG: V-type ATP synthase subunit I [Myxococcales bacterium]